MFLFLRETNNFEWSCKACSEEGEMENAREVERSVEVPERKGGDGVCSIRMLLFDSCQDWETEFCSLVLQGRQDGKLVRWATSCLLYPNRLLIWVPTEKHRKTVQRLCRERHNYRKR